VTTQKSKQLMKTINIQKN